LGRFLANNKDENSDPLLLIGGTSLRVYLLLLQSEKPLGIREVQRILGFKSPTTARHHLERLVELGLATRTPMGYKPLRPKGVLGELVFHAGRILPRSIFLSSFLVSSVIGCLATELCGLMGVTLLSVASAVSVYDSFRVYRAWSRVMKLGENE
jgi:DNA-binding transcriptional ArsR family regulator